MKIMKKFLTILSICFFVSWGVYTSTGICGDFIEDLRKAAEKGDAVAQNNLGAAYLNGEGVPKNMTEAVKWFREAAERIRIDRESEANHDLIL